jgi:hypothetical protein
MSGSQVKSFSNTTAPILWNDWIVFHRNEIIKGIFELKYSDWFVWILSSLYSELLFNLAWPLHQISTLRNVRCISSKKSRGLFYFILLFVKVIKRCRDRGEGLWDYSLLFYCIWLKILLLLSVKKASLINSYLNKRER